MDERQDHRREQKELWDGFVADLVPPMAADELNRFANKRVLITGAGGYLGSALARALAAASAKQLILLDIAEFGLYRLEQDLSATGSVAEAVFLVGSVCDDLLLREIFSQYQPEIVLHAAALKHVPLMEENALAAGQTNVLGTAALVAAAAKAMVTSFVLLSTDKAVEPISVMGATKRLAEQIVLRERQHAPGGSSFNVIRLCNVLGSTGSVAPLFARQIAAGEPLTVSDPAATRFFLSRTDAVRLILRASLAGSMTGLTLPHVGPARRIEDLALYLLGRVTNTTTTGVTYTGLRSADKLHEQLVGPGETISTQASVSPSYAVQSPFSETALQAALTDIKLAVATRDRKLLMQAIHGAVPDYLQQVATLQQQRDGVSA